MSRSRLFAAAVVGALVAAGLTAASASSTSASNSEAAADIPSACPSDTAMTTFLGGDDFEPSTDADPDNKIHLDWNITDGGAFQIVESTNIPGNHYLKGANPVQPGTTSVATTSPIHLPADQTSVLTFAHQPNLDPQTRAIVDIAIGEDWHRLGEFSPTTDSRRAQFDLRAHAGNDVRLRFSIDASNTTFTGSGKGWNINDVFFHSCDPATLPLAPTDVKAAGQLDGDVTVTWSTVADSDQTNNPTHYEVTRSPGNVVVVSPGWHEVTFDGLDRNTKYTFEVRGVNKAGTGPASTAGLVPTSLTSSAPSSVVVFGEAVTLRGKLSRTDTGSGLANKRLELQTRPKGSTGAWGYLTTLTTAENGTYSITKRPRRSVQYRIRFSMYDGGFWPVDSRTQTATVRPLVSGSWIDATIKRGQEATFKGKVTPNEYGQRGKKVYLQRRLADGTWRTHTWNYIGQWSAFSPSLEFNSKGTFYYRAYVRATSIRAAGWTPTRKITVS